MATVNIVNKTTLSEREIEARVEKMFDRLDKSFMEGAMSQEEYDICVESINQLAEKFYRDNAAKE